MTSYDLLRLQTELRAAQNRASFLAEASRVLALSLDYHETLRSVARLAVPALADWCAVDLVGETGALERVAVQHVDAEKIRFVHQLQGRYPADPESRHGVHEVIRTGQPLYMAEIPDALLVSTARDEEHLRLIRELRLHSIVAAPLSARGRVLGALTFVYAESGRVYDAGDVSLIGELAQRAAVAIDNARLVLDLALSQEELQHQAIELESQAAELESQVDEAHLLNAELDARQQQMAALHAVLSDAEQRLEIAQDAGGVGTFDWDIGTDAVAWTTQEERLFGLEPGTFEGHISGWARRVHPDDVARLQAEFAASWQERRSDATYEFRALWPDGSTHWLTGGGRFFYDPDGRPVRMVGVNLDVTDRQRATQRVTALQRVTAALADAVSAERVAEIALEQAFAMLGATSGVLYRLSDDRSALDLVSGRGIRPELLAQYAQYPVEQKLPLADALRSRAAVYLGSDEERTAGYPELARRHPQVDHKAWAALPLVVEGRAVGGLALNFDQPMAFAPPEREYIEAIARQCAQALERVRLFAAEHHARQRAEILAESGSVLSSSLDVEATLDALARLVVPRVADWCFVEIPTSDGRIEAVAVRHSDPEQVQWVRAIMRRFPVDPAAPHGTGFVLRTGEPEIVPEIPADFYTSLTSDPDLLEAYRQVGFRSFISVPLSVRGRVLGVLSLVMAESGRRFGPGDLGFMQDLAARAALAVANAQLYQAQLHARAIAEQANRAKGEFLAVMSHELRTPLNAIIGYEDLLQAEIVGPLNDVQKTHLGRVSVAAHQLLALIEQVLSFSRAEAGKERILSLPTDMVALVGEAASLIEPGARLKQLGFDIALPDEPVTFETDAHKVQQVVLNLLSNAVKFTDGGTVGVRLRAFAGHVEVQVWDTGCGISPGDLERVFEPFEQVDNSATRRHGGTGLGLAVSRQLARLLGGDVTVTSTLGRGSTFTLTLFRTLAHTPPLADSVA